MEAYDSYVTTLDADVLARAEELWGEDEDLRNRTLQTMRQWIGQQPHFICRADARYLVMFARGCNYDVDEMKRKLEVLVTMLTSVPEFFSGWDPMRPEIQAALRVGLQLPLPGYDIHGRKVIVVRNGCFDPQKHKPEDLEKANFMGMESLAKREERISIGGVVIIFDMKGVTMGHMLHKPLSLVKKHMKYIQEAVPFNPKGMIFIHTSPVISMAVNMMTSVFNEKLKRTVRVLGNDLDALQEIVGKEVLPSDYGGDGMSLEELTVLLKNCIEEDREHLRAQEIYGVDETKRPVKAKSSLFSFLW